MLKILSKEDRGRNHAAHALRRPGLIAGTWKKSVFQSISAYGGGFDYPLYRAGIVGRRPDSCKDHSRRKNRLADVLKKTHGKWGGERHASKGCVGDLSAWGEGGSKKIRLGRQQKKSLSRWAGKDGAAKTKGSEKIFFPRIGEDWTNLVNVGKRHR